MATIAEIMNRRNEILAVAQRNGASMVRIFGSLARGESADSSDLDLLVRFDPNRSLMDHGMLIEELQSLLGMKVDVVSDAALSDRDRFTDRLAKEAVPL